MEIFYPNLIDIQMAEHLYKKRSRYLEVNGECSQRKDRNFNKYKEKSTRGVLKMWFLFGILYRKKFLTLKFKIFFFFNF